MSFPSAGHVTPLSLPALGQELLVPPRPWQRGRPPRRGRCDGSHTSQLPAKQGTACSCPLTCSKGSKLRGWHCSRGHSKAPVPTAHRTRALQSKGCKSSVMSHRETLKNPGYLPLEPSQALPGLLMLGEFTTASSPDSCKL